MTNFLIAAVVICLAAAVVCLAAIAWLLICIQETLSKIYKEFWVSQRENKYFWQANLSGPDHTFAGKRLWIRRSPDRYCHLVWNVGAWDGSNEITDLGGSMCGAEVGTNVDAMECRVEMLEKENQRLDVRVRRLEQEIDELRREL